MLNAVDYAVNEITWAIPKEILEKTFIKVVPRFKSVRDATGLNALIKSKIIHGKVLVDCNLIGANEIDVGVNPSWVEMVSQNELVIRIPKGFTQNRSIIEVLSLNYGTGNVGGMVHGNIGIAPTPTLTNVLNKLANNNTPPVLMSNVRTEVVGENVIAVSGLNRIPHHAFLTVMVEHDEQMSQLRRQAYPRFAELCVLATKAYIWANKVIILDKGEVEGGYDLNRFSSIIESYEDSYNEYKEYFNEVWRKTAWFADPRRQAKHIELITRLGLPS